MSEIFGEILSSVGEKLSEKVKSSLDFSSFLQKQLSELEAKYEQDLIPEELYEETKANILGFFQDFGDDFDALKQKISQEKQEIMKQIGVELSQEKKTLQAQMSIYELADIDQYTYQNGAVKQFAKGLIDELIIGNAELIETVISQGPEILWEGIKNLFTWEGIKDMLASLGMSISDLFSGNAYKTGISVAVFAGGLLKAGSGALKTSLKRSAKEVNLDVTYFSKNVGYKIEGKTLKVENIDVDLLTPEDMKSMMYSLLEDAKKSGTEITEIDFGPSLKPEIKELLHHTLAQNFPILNISRLSDGDSVVNFTYAGVKTLNDSVSKEFVDLIVAQVQSKMAYEFAGFEKTRNVRENYKHQTFSLKDGKNIPSILQEKFGSSQKMVHEIFDSLSDDEILVALQGTKNPDLITLLDSGNIGEIRKILSEQLDENFVIQSGIGEVAQNADILEKSLSLHQAENSATTGNNNVFEFGKFDFEVLQKAAKDIMRMQDNILTNFHNSVVLIDDLPYKVIQDGSINPVLLGKVRKGSDIGDAKLQEQLTQYVKQLNKNFDFIAPFQRGDSLENTIQNLNQTIQTGKISVSDLMTNYKGQYTPEALAFLTKDEIGTRVFADIKDMGVMNLLEFQKLAQKVANGEIHAGNKHELLYAGEKVTQNFLQASEAIKNNFPNAIISMDGDEIKIFIPELKAGFDEEIGEILSHFSLKSRVGTSDTAGMHTFGMLDSQSQILKLIEAKLGQIEAKIGHSLHNNFLTFEGIEKIGDVRQLQEIIKKFSPDNLQIFMNSTKEKLIIGQIDNLPIIIKKLPNNNFGLSIES